MMRYEYSNSKIEWIGKYPKHWKVFRISQRVESIVGGEWGSDLDTDETGGSKEIVVLRVSDFNDIYLSFDNLTLRRVKETKIPNRLITSNCLIMEKSGGGEKQLVGRVAEARDLKFEAITSNFIAKLEFDTKVDSHFMNYVFHDLYNSNLNFPFVQQTTGIQNINSTYYLYTKVPFPPKYEQIAIAKYLDKTCIEIDRVVEIKRKQIENLKLQLKSIIHHTVTKGLNPKAEMKESCIDWIGKVPKHWKVDRLKDIAELNYEVLGSQTSKDFLLKYIDISNVNYKGIISLENIEEIEFEIAPSRARRVIKKGDVIVSSVRPNLQAIAYIELDDENLICSTGFNVIKAKEHIALPKFLHQFILSEYSKQYFERTAKGVGYPAVADRDFNTLYLFLPPLNEQDEIIEYLDDEINKVKNTEAKIEKQIEIILNYKKSVIHEVVTGKKQVYGLTKD